MRKSMIPLLAAALFSGSVYLSAQNAESGLVPSAAVQKKQVVKVVFFPFREAILASRIDGVVLENNLRIGQRFKQGEVLVRLDDVRFRVELERVQALEKESIALCDFAKETLKAQEDMFKQAMISEIDFKKAKLDVETSAARLLAIRANLKEAQNQLSYCVISAPIAGRIEEIATRSFENLRAGQPLVRIIDDNLLKAVMFVPVSLLEQLKPGTDVDLFCTDTKKAIKGKVYEIAPRADHRSGTIEIHAVVDNRDGGITAGMTGEFSYAGTR